MTGAAKDPIEELKELMKKLPISSTAHKRAAELIKEIPSQTLCDMGLGPPPKPVVPKGLEKLPAGKRLQELQKVISSIHYNHENGYMYNVSKDRHFSRIMDTSREILREALPIKCIEAVFLGGLTCLASLAENVIRIKKQNKAAYNKWWHTLLKVRLGLPFEHDAFYNGPVCWRLTNILLQKYSWEECKDVMDKFTAHSRHLATKYKLTGITPDLKTIAYSYVAKKGGSPVRVRPSAKDNATVKIPADRANATSPSRRQKPPPAPGGQAQAKGTKPNTPKDQPAESAGGSTQDDVKGSQATESEYTAATGEGATDTTAAPSDAQAADPVSTSDPGAGGGGQGSDLKVVEAKVEKESKPRQEGRVEDSESDSDDEDYRSDALVLPVVAERDIHMGSTM
eukprot:gene14804-20859_t